MKISAWARATAGASLFLVAAAPAWAADGWDGEFKTKGTHSAKGAFTGNFDVDVKSDGKTAKLSEQIVFSSGKKATLTGTGTISGQKLTVSFRVGSGLSGVVGGLAGSKATGSYTLSADGKTATGGWKINSKNRTTETLTRSSSSTDPGTTANGDLLKLVNSSGKPVAEECVSQNPFGKSNALVALKVSKAASAAAGSKFTITYGARVNVWKTNARSEKVASGSELANEDATLFVEGLTPSDAGVGETISTKIGSTESKVTVHVARSGFHLAGHGAGGAYRMESWLESARKDGRSEPTFVEGKDEKNQKKVFWAIWVIENDAEAKLALGVDDAVVSYDGHSNFGMGFAFQTGFSKISQFLNIADPQIPVNWQYLREHQEHPNLMIDDSEYGDDAGTPAFSDPVAIGKTIHGKLGDYDTSRYPLSGAQGTRYKLTRGSKKFLDHHYGDDDNWRIVVKAGSADMPVKKWRKIYLHSCYSGQYYSDSFGGKGSLFFTYDEAHAWSEALPAFMKACVEGKSNADILKAINDKENLNDYLEFGN